MHMWITKDERDLAESIARLAYANPFLHERIACERAIMGEQLPAGRLFWHADQGSVQIVPIQRRVEPLVETLITRLRDGVKIPAGDQDLYRDVILYWLYGRYETDLFELLGRPDHGTKRIAWYGRFCDDFASAAEPAGGFEGDFCPPTMFAFFFQLRRAFHLIFRQIYGGSLPAAQLRAAAWESVFTHDMRRYRRSLFRRMDDVTTLITGPSGTGKELVARAVGFSRYIPFDPAKQAFTEDFESSFYPVNLSALSPTLIESELFGHRRGAFTGAVEDRRGWLETCPPLGTIFLDEIGEIDQAIQVKLLRVLETRTFQRLGDTQDLPFKGKIVAATNRDFAHEMRRGVIRPDFYYRLCSDLIRTPSLAEQIRDAPDELDNFVKALSRRIAGEDEGQLLAEQTLRWIREELGAGYPWPGNVRELEQCVRNIMIRGAYRPLPPSEAHPEGALESALSACTLSLEELGGRYIEAVYQRTGSYQAAARRLGIDRRTVKARLSRS